MTGRGPWTALDALLEGGTWDEERIRCAWVYGGRALEPRKRDGDLDLIVVVDSRLRPRRQARTLPDGTILTVNVIGPECLGPHHPELNGGFYFTGKLLGPRILVADQQGGAEGLLARAFAQMLTWTCMIAPVSSQNEPDSSALLARLFLLKFGITPCYLCHFARWRQNVGFTALWAASCRVMDEARGLLAAGDVAPVPPLFQTETGDDRELAIEYLTTTWWRTNLSIRENDPEYLNSFFERHLQMARALGPSALDDTRAFVTRLAEGSA